MLGLEHWQRAALAVCQRAALAVAHEQPKWVPVKKCGTVNWPPHCWNSGFGDIAALLLEQLASAAVSDGALHLEFVTLSKAHWPVSWQLPQGPAKVPYTGYVR